MEHLEEYQETLKEFLATACMDRLDDGTCAPPKGRRCALDLNLAPIVQAVKAVKSDRLDEYAGSVRDTVCIQCINQSEHGECEVRDQMDCCLNNFMSLVVDAIDAVDARYEENAPSAR